MKSTQQNLPGGKKPRGTIKTDDIQEKVIGKEQIAIPIVEERLEVGKEAVETGGVRVEKRVNERPVQEQIELKEERVNVERRPVDRPAQPGDVEAFQEGSMEFVERGERAVVSKEARVVEEVLVNKDVQRRTETVSDTLRYTTVSVEQLGKRGDLAGRGFEAYDQDFKTHFSSAGYADARYEDYLPAYQYGYDVGGVERYRGKDWNDIEPEVSSAWENRNPGTWARIKGSVRHAWNKATSKA